MSKKSALVYAQSGGMTAVINATAAGVLTAASPYKNELRVYAAHNGVLGILEEDFIDLRSVSAADIHRLRQLPGGAFGSSRFPLGTPLTNPAYYQRLIDVMAAHDVRWFLHNGGGGSAATSRYIADAAEQAGYPLSVIHLPKTVDNDLYLTDFSPGFGSVAKYAAMSVQEAALDLASMARTSTRVFVMEVMGRRAGWIAAASALARTYKNGKATGAPHLILFPEVPFAEAEFLKAVTKTVQQEGFCVIVAAEGLAWPDTSNGLTTSSSTHDTVAAGRIAPRIAALIEQELKLPCHFAICDYLQRSARHVASQVDVEAAFAVGAVGVQWALSGHHRVMVGITRHGTGLHPRFSYTPVPLSRVAAKERRLPARFIRRDGFGITSACRDYLQPLIVGEDRPDFYRGLPLPPPVLGRPVTPRLARWQTLPS